MLIMNQEYLKKQRERRKLNGDANTKKYEKTINGLLMRRYRNMETRVLGLGQKKRHLYMGKELMPREVFYEWSLKSPEFNSLYLKWKEGGFDRKISPSVDRIDSAKGYTLDNVRWITFSENCSLGTKAQTGIKKKYLPINTFNIPE